MNGYFLKLLENNPKFMSLKITGLSLDILWKNKNANYKAIEDSLADMLEVLNTIAKIR